MSIEFDDIPSKLRKPGTYIEFNGRLAGNSVFDGKAVLTGQRLTTGSVPAGTLIRIGSDAATLDTQFGRGAMLTEMCKAAKKAQPWLEMWAVAVDDNPAGVEAVKKITWTGAATQSGTLPVYIGFYRVQVAVAVGDTANDVAAAIVAAAALVTDKPMSAAVNGTNANEVDLTCLWKGETGSDIDVRIGYHITDKIPAGLSFTISETTAGAGNPDITPALDATGAEWFNWLAVPYTDAANLTVLETELGDRFGPMQAIGGRAFTAYTGTHAATGTFGNSRNSQHVLCKGTGASPTPTWIWAAVDMAVSGHSLSIDPSRQMRGKHLPGIAPPALEDRWDDPMSNELLFDGISTYTVDAGGRVLLEAQISMYQVNAGGSDDDAWLYINTPETLERIRLEQTHFFNQRYPNWKLAKDNYDVPPGQPIMQPKKANIELLALYKTFMDKGWVQNYQGYKQTLFSEINADNSDRLDVYDNPELIKNMRVTAIHSEFK